MSIIDSIKDKVSKVTPDAVEDLVFGSRTAPKTPTTPEEARKLIDASIGRQPEDSKIIREFHAADLTAKAIQALDRASEGYFSMSPFDETTKAQWATGSLPVIADPYVIADMDLQRIFQRNPRASLLYAREYDPLNPEILPIVVEANAKRHGGLLSMWKNTVTDLAGRPIGTAIELLGKPSKWAEEEYGSRFVWNDIGDSSLRHTMAKYTYEARLNVKDWNRSWEDRARLKALEIESKGLEGDAASASFEEWVHSEGNPGMAAAITDLVAQITFDPLWLIPGDTLFKGGGKLARGAAGLEKGKPGANIFRLIESFTARSKFGFDSVKEMVNADNIAYSTAKITTPGLRGSMLWLSERTPMRIADAAGRDVSYTLSNALTRTTNLEEQFDVLSHFDETMRTGKVNGKAIEHFGADLFQRHPVLADYSALLTHKKRSAAEGWLEGLQKNPRLAEAPIEEINKIAVWYLSDLASSIAKEAQAARFPRWFNKRVAPFIAWQKSIMSMFTLSTPRFVAYNMGNNLFTYMWQGMRHPGSAIDMYQQSMRAEWGSKEIPLIQQKLARTLGIDASDIARTVAGNVTKRELLGDKPGEVFNVGDEAFDTKQALNLARQSIDKPIRDLTKFRIRDLITWPIVAASKVDRQTRSATYYNAINEQLNLALSRSRTINGLIPDLRTTLETAGANPEMAGRWEDFMLSHMRAWIQSDAGTLADPAALRAAWLDGVDKLADASPHGYVSAYNYAMQFATDRGLNEVAATHWLRDLDPAIVKSTNEALVQMDDVPLPTLLSKLDKIGYEYLQVDEMLARATNTPPILRPSTDYSKQLPPEQVMREDMIDGVRHIDRLADRVLPDWTGNSTAKRAIFSSAEDMIHGRLTRLSEISRKKIGALAAGAADTTEWKKAEKDLWDDYWKFQTDSQFNFFETVRRELSSVDAKVDEQIESWYATLLKTQAKHREEIQHAMDVNSAAGWKMAGERVENLYVQAAEKRADIFGVNMNETPFNMGHTRPTAPLVTQVLDYIDYMKARLPQDIARVRRGDEAIKVGGNHIDAIKQMADEVAERGPELARVVAGNARAKTDFVMLDYDNQRGADAMMQMFFPYEFFPTRTAVNWGIRVARNPGAGAAMALAIMNPGEYAERYGIPSRHRFKIPIPIPFLQDWLKNVPVIGAKIEGADFDDVYWVDPLQYMFPLTSFRQDYEEDKATTAGLGGVASFAEEYALNLSPFAKIVGGYTGFLDRDAWTNSVFQGGPFGIPMTAYGAAVGKWIYTGDGSDVPDEEKDLFSSVGHFSRKFLANILGLDGGRFDEYRRERAVASLLAEGKITPDEATEALYSHEGKAWKMAIKAAEGEKFLSDITGHLGFRLGGSLKGEVILRGQRALYSKAAANGTLDQFYEKYPEYQVYKLAVRGLSDPVEQQGELETQLYYRDIETYVNQPYQKTLDQIETEMDAIRKKDTLTEIDKEQLMFLNDNVQAIKEEQREVRAQLEIAYPNRSQEASLRMPPKERALRKISDGWYALEQNEGESYDDFQSRRADWLRQFPARGLDQGENDWQDLFVTYNQTLAKFNLLVNKAYNEGDFDKGEKLSEERDAILESIHETAESRVSRYDVEHYLAQFQRTATPAEVEFNDASNMFELWMSLVTDGSPLTSQQKAAVSAYFRAQPILQKHYNASTIDIRSLNGDQLVALARRKEIMSHYYDLGTDDAKIDYMRSVAFEYNEYNRMLGLPPALIIDARPEPPQRRFDPDTAQKDFTGDMTGADYLLSGKDFDANTAVTMAPADIMRYVDAAIARGY